VSGSEYPGERRNRFLQLICITRHKMRNTVYRIRADEAFVWPLITYLFPRWFQFLAVISLTGTLITTVTVSSLGSTFGIDGANDPVAWLVFVGGLFVTCVLAGFGYTVGILCAIYDRNEPTVSTVVSGSSPGTANIDRRPAPHETNPRTFWNEGEGTPTGNPMKTRK